MKDLRGDVPLILLKGSMRPRKHIPTKRILHQLRQDVALCSSIQVEDSAWSNGRLEHSVAKIAGGPKVLGRLLSGVPQPEWNAWEKLEVVTSDWATPKAKPQPELLCPEPIAQSYTLPAAPSTLDDSVNADLQLLLECEAEQNSDHQRTSFDQASGSSADQATESPADQATEPQATLDDFDEGAFFDGDLASEETPFAFTDKSGKPAFATPFRYTRKMPNTGKATPKGDKLMMDGGDPTPDNNEWTPDNDEWTPDNDEPTSDDDEWTPDDDEPTPDDENNDIEEPISEDQEATPKQRRPRSNLTKATRVPCHQCGTIIRHGDRATHLYYCKGRCSECVKARKACTKAGGGSSKCRRCTTLKLDCSGFSHAHLRKPDLVICDQCSRTCRRREMRKHLRTCKGRCQPCQLAGEPCIFVSASSKRCNYCIKNKKTCEGHSHPRPAETPKEPCVKCGRAYSAKGGTMKKHLERCKGQCYPCAEAGAPCIWPSPKSKKCTRCADSEEEIECTYSQSQ